MHNSGPTSTPLPPLVPMCSLPTADLASPRTLDKPSDRDRGILRPGSSAGAHTQMRLGSAQLARVQLRPPRSASAKLLWRSGLAGPAAQEAFPRSASPLPADDEPAPAPPSSTEPAEPPPAADAPEEADEPMPRLQLSDLASAVLAPPAPQPSRVASRLWRRVTRNASWSALSPGPAQSVSVAASGSAAGSAGAPAGAAATTGTVAAAGGEDGAGGGEPKPRARLPPSRVNHGDPGGASASYERACSCRTPGDGPCCCLASRGLPSAQLSCRTFVLACQVVPATAVPAGADVATRTQSMTALAGLRHALSATRSFIAGGAARMADGLRVADLRHSPCARSRAAPRHLPSPTRILTSRRLPAAAQPRWRARPPRRQQPPPRRAPVRDCPRLGFPLPPLPPLRHPVPGQRQRRACAPARQ
jgi:hypothetical protein